MMSEMAFITKLHESTSRDYLGRMCADKPSWMEIASKYDKDYWDGDRNHGYGGYKYIPGRWRPVAEALIEHYNLGCNSKLLDVGCGKGFLLYEIQLLLPTIRIVGVDVSSYALEQRHPSLNGEFRLADATSDLRFKENEFDLAISLGTFHNFEIPQLKNALKAINNVARNKYIMVESYRNKHELFNLQCWALTCQSFFSPVEWNWLFKEFGYDGDYEFIYFE